MSSAKDTEHLINKKILRVCKAVKHPLSVLSAILYTGLSYTELPIIYTLFRPTGKETTRIILFQKLKDPI